MHLTGLDLFLWTVGLSLHLALLYVLVVRRHAATFPAFSALVLFNILKTLGLYAVHAFAGKTAYFYTYWSLGLVDALLQLAVVYELCRHTFRPLRTWPEDLRGGFIRLAAVSVSVALAVTWLATPHTRFGIQAVVMKASFLSSVLMSELLVGMIVLSVRAGLPSKSHVARIAQGLGVFSMVDILIETMHIAFGVARGTAIYTELSRARIAVYLGCVIYWIVTLRRPAAEPKKMPLALSWQVARVQQMVDGELELLRERGRI